MIEFAAPGKAVIWGEYAVLEGAPALVMAVDRYARASIQTAEDAWHIEALGFEDRQVLNARELSRAGGAAMTVGAALKGLGHPPLPAGAAVVTDTTAFYRNGQKLGIGSSAAVCTALCAALASFLERPFDNQAALTAHQALQGSGGSGLDVAAACQGGLIRFQEGSSSAASWPRGWHHRFVWVGQPASTPRKLARFSEWRATADTQPLTELGRMSERLFDNPELEALRAYVAALEHLDARAGLGIYDGAHRRAAELANLAQVVYKPCGAGGGDIGIAVSDDAAALHTFLTLAAERSFLSLDLEIADHGVHQTR